MGQRDRGMNMLIGRCIRHKKLLVAEASKGIGGKAWRGTRGTYGEMHEERVPGIWPEKLLVCMPC